MPQSGTFGSKASKPYIARKSSNGTILSNIDILNLANRLNLPLIGCFSKDQLPKRKIKGDFVVNLGDASTGGSHWTCFSTKDKMVYYYDSFGAPPPIEVDQYI